MRDTVAIPGYAAVATTTVRLTDMSILLILQVSVVVQKMRAVAPLAVKI